MEWIRELTEKQRSCHSSGKTLPYKFRKKQLNRFKDMLRKYEKEIYAALHRDLRKSRHETLTAELGILHTEIDTMLSGLKEWMAPENVKAPLTHFGTSSKIHYEPYGVALIIAPWNYPLQLALAPAIGALAAGNTVIIKPSEHSSHTSTLIRTMIENTFPESYCAVVEGGKEVTQSLLDQHLDYVFFTGSTAVGRKVMEQASRQLIPVTLEMGGKSPAIVDKDASVDLAAKRIVWGKFMNAGQTCVAPDYVYVHHGVKQKFISKLEKYIKRFYGKRPLENKEYVQIIHLKHFQRLVDFLANGTLIHGGGFDRESLLMEPALLDNITWQDPVMQEEIFGPILPILSFRNVDEAASAIKHDEKPLALYYFGKSQKRQKRVLQQVSFGGGSFNDTLYHLGNPHLPFGGVGHSGMGSYHGKHSFLTFSHQKGIMSQTNLFDLPFRYPDGGKIREMIVRKLMS